MALAEPRGGTSSSAPRTLTLRIVSALVMAPVAIAAAWFGSPWLPILIAAAGGVMAWEWARLCGGGRVGTNGALLMITVLVAIVAAATLGTVPAVLISLLGAVLVRAVTAPKNGIGAHWPALGTLWVALPCVLLLWIAQREGTGRLTVLWIFAVVWATDIGAYAVGRRLGGPRLAPRWSPGKTWAGLVGGVVCAALAGWATTGILGISSALPLVLVSAGLAIVEQFGDLAESLAKRRFGVKDSSGLIPGHGGLLDRLDGLLAVVPAVAVLTLIGGGSVLEWR